MNRETLEQILNTEGIRPDAYDLEGIGRDESYVLSGGPDNWSVYYSERGLKTGERRFPTETSACQYLLGVLMDDPSTKFT
jgi:hypothetical protein